MIHPQLEQDSHYLGALGSGSVLLHRNASLPWFILVPDTELEDVLDLPADLLARVMADCQQLSRFIKQELGFAKVNFAGLGNVVPQLHLHVIGRAVGDACWPQPVWGNLTEELSYDSDILADWRRRLVAKYTLHDKE